MSNLSTYNIQDWTVLGRNFFKPPFKVSDTLINEAKIGFVAHGHSQLYAANQFAELQAGDVFIMKSDNFINHWLPNETEQLNEVIIFQLTSELLKDIYQNNPPSWFLNYAGEQVSPIQKQAPHFLLTDYFNNLRYYFDHPQYMSEGLLRTKIQELLHILVVTDKTGSNQAILGSLFQANEYKFQEVIQTHLFEDLNLEDLAFLTGLSLSSFKRKFSTVYNSSPNKYFIAKRMEKAELMLKISDLRISDIAYDCGYSDVGYFSKTFHKYHQCTPSQFREQFVN